MVTMPRLRVLAVLEGGAALSRQDLHESIGYSGKSGTVTKAMNGIRDGSSSG
jgi:hypothetical protein